MPTGSKNEKEAKRRKVAAGVVAGKSPKAIAKAAGCNTRHAQRLAEEPATKLLITELLAPHHKKLNKLVDQAITAVSLALAAKKVDKADHSVRLRAVARTKQLLELAQGKEAEGAGEPGLVTWEEFTLLYRKRTEGSVANQ